MDSEWNPDPTLSRRSKSESSERSAQRNGSSRSERRSRIYEDLWLQLTTTTERLRAEETRVFDAESQLERMAAHFKQMNEDRRTALRDAAKAKEELRWVTRHIDFASNIFFKPGCTKCNIARRRMRSYAHKK